MDDYSTDGSFEYIEELAKDDKRLKVLELTKNSGSAAARNKGLSIASGRYITFLDSDDTIGNNYLESQIEL